MKAGEPRVGPIERRKVYGSWQRLIDDIAARRLKPGDPIPAERQLTEALSVGRSSIREPCGCSSPAG